MAGEEAVEGNNKRKFSSSTSLPRTSPSLPRTSTSLLPLTSTALCQARTSIGATAVQERANWVEIETLDKDDETTF